MLSSVTSFVPDGLSARPVRVAVDVHRGLPGFAIVGLPGAAAREAHERVRAALTNSGHEFPLRRVVVDVTPADPRPVGAGLDLPIAAALLKASGQLDWTGIEKVAFVGGLALDGRVCPVGGALAIAEAAREAGVTTLVMPAADCPEAALGGVGEIRPVGDLAGLAALGSGGGAPPPAPLPLPTGSPAGGPDLADLRGRPRLCRALELAAAGGHGLLLVGPPGSGRAMAARRLPSILPPLGRAEALDVVRIAGATGRLDPRVPRGRPFRAPHHTISAAGLLGGGTPPRPGEVTRAHHGVLFLDDLDRFRREAIEALRPALEAGEVTIERAGVRRRFPCRPLLVAASAPCPCGEGDGGCVCRPLDVLRFRRRVVRSLGGCLDLRLELTRPTQREIAGPPAESSAAVRERVLAARERAEARLGAGRTNARMSAEEVRRVPLTSGAVRLLAARRSRGPIPRPPADRTIRVARTVADLAGSEVVGEDAMCIALGLRGEDRPGTAA